MPFNKSIHLGQGHVGDQSCAQRLLELQIFRRSADLHLDLGPCTLDFWLWTSDIGHGCGWVGAEGVYDILWFSIVLSWCLVLHCLSTELWICGAIGDFLERVAGASWTLLGHFGGAVGQGNTTTDQARCVKAMDFRDCWYFLCFIIGVEVRVSMVGVVEGWVLEMLIFLWFYMLCWDRAWGPWFFGSWKCVYVRVCFC